MDKQEINKMNFIMLNIKLNIFEYRKQRLKRI